MKMTSLQIIITLLAGASFVLIYQDIKSRIKWLNRGRIKVNPDGTKTIDVDVPKLLDSYAVSLIALQLISSWIAGLQQGEVLPGNKILTAEEWLNYSLTLGELK